VLTLPLLGHYLCCRSSEGRCLVQYDPQGIASDRETGKRHLPLLKSDEMLDYIRD